MKKSVLFTLAVLAAGAFSANAQEVTYVEDCSQGYLMNKAKDNWFMTVQGGSNILFGKDNIHAELKTVLVAMLVFTSVNGLLLPSDSVSVDSTL